MALSMGKIAVVGLDEELHGYAASFSGFLSDQSTAISPCRRGPGCAFVRRSVFFASGSRTE